MVTDVSTTLVTKVSVKTEATTMPNLATEIVSILSLPKAERWHLQCQAILKYPYKSWYGLSGELSADLEKTAQHYG